MTRAFSITPMSSRTWTTDGSSKLKGITTVNKTILPILAVVARTFGVISVVRSQPKREPTSPLSPPPGSSFEHSVAAVGLIEASTENIAIGSHLAGVVDKVFVTVGDAVKAG